MNDDRSAVPPVGDGIAAPASGWTFHDPAVAAAFDAHVALSTPGYEDLQRLIGRLSAYFVHDGSAVVDYGCATGRTIAEIARVNQGRRVRYIGVDEAEPMAQQARERLSKTPGIEVRTASVSATLPPPDTSLLLAVYALQFMPFAARLTAIRAWHEATTPGTTLILVEKTVADDSALAVPFSDLHHDEKLEAYSPDEVIGKARSLRGILRPITASATEAMLISSGWSFQRFWQHLAFVGWVCTRL